MAAFTIPKRAVGLGDAGVRMALARVSETWPKNDAGDFAFEKGFQLEHLTALMNGTPRGFCLLAKHGHIPVTEAQALQMIFESGRTFEQVRVPVAQVQRVDPSPGLMRLLLERGYRKIVRPKTTEPVKVITV